MAVVFDEPTQTGGARVNRKGPSVLSRMVMKLELAKTEKGAQTVLLIIAVLALVAAVGVLWMQVPQYEALPGVDDTAV